MIHVLHGAVLWSIWTIACTRLYTRYVVVDISLATPFNNTFYLYWLWVWLEWDCEWSNLTALVGFLLERINCATVSPNICACFRAIGGRSHVVADHVDVLQHHPFPRFSNFFFFRSLSLFPSSYSFLFLFSFFFFNFLFFGHAISACEKKDGS